MKNIKRLIYKPLIGKGGKNYFTSINDFSEPYVTKFKTFHLKRILDEDVHYIIRKIRKIRK